MAVLAERVDLQFGGKFKFLIRRRKYLRKRCILERDSWCWYRSETSYIDEQSVDHSRDGGSFLNDRLIHAAMVKASDVALQKQSCDSMLRTTLLQGH